MATLFPNLFQVSAIGIIVSTIAGTSACFYIFLTGNFSFVIYFNSNNIY